MPTAPGETRAGVIKVITVSLTTVKDVAYIPPIVTAVVPVKSLPLIVTIVPPLVLPVNGKIPLIEAGVTKVKEANMPLGPPPVRTITPAAPTAPSGVIQVSVVSSTTVILVETPLPNETDVAPVRFVPVIVILFPPALFPAGGKIALITGGVI